MVRRLLGLAAAAALVAAAAASAKTVRPPVAFAFDRVNTAPGDRVTVHAQGFRSQRAARLYLVRSSLAASIRSRFDTRLAFIGTLRPRGGHAMFVFTVPPLDTGTYVPWCAGCGGRRTGSLRVTMPAATADSCPVTIPNTEPPPGLQGVYHGNGALWTTLPADGVFVARPDSRWPDGPIGSIGTKLFWWAAGVDGTFTLSGHRLDASSAPLVVHRVNRGRQAGFRGSGTWATPVSFPTPGCWKLTARLADVNLSYVVKVTVA